MTAMRRQTACSEQTARASRLPRGSASSSRALKRALDLVAAGAGLILAAPLLLLLALLLRLTLGAPVIFRQSRAGQSGRPFVMYKLRTMRDVTDGEGRPLSDERRLTQLGRFLRSASLDELPELWNVIRGEMSLVGPRPLLLDYLSRYTPEQARRHDVRPGITGLAQIGGRNTLSWEQKFELDVRYVDHWSLWLDARILLLTFLKVVKREGVSAAGHATMPEFGGSSECQRM